MSQALQWHIYTKRKVITKHHSTKQKCIKIYANEGARKGLQLRKTVSYMFLVVSLEMVGKVMLLPVQAVHCFCSCHLNALHGTEPHTKVTAN